MKRVPTDQCLLCKTEEATRTNSHWVPASLLKSMIGKRDKEESNAFSSYIISRLDTYYGRSNLKNTDTTLREHHYALDFIFCDNCENRLAVIEGIVPKIIQDEIRLSNKASNYQEDLSLLNIPFKKCLRLDNSIYRLFIYSIVWRISMIYRLKHGFEILELDYENKLRIILNEYLNMDPVAIKNNGAKIPNYDFQIVSADTFKPDTGNIVYTEKIYQNPNVYYVNEFIILFYPHGYAVSGQDSYHIPIKSIIEFPEILNSVDDDPKIGFITGDHFRNLTQIVFRDLAKDVVNEITKKVVDCSGASFVESRMLINRIGLDIQRVTGQPITDCFKSAANILIGKRNDHFYI